MKKGLVVRSALEFGTRLEELDIEFNILPLLKFGKELIVDLNRFDITKINYQVDKLSRLIEIITDG